MPNIELNGLDIHDFILEVESVFFVSTVCSDHSIYLNTHFH